MQLFLHRPGRAALGALALVLVTRLALAEPNDWPRFRGPDNNDVSAETGLLQDWPAGGPPLVWKAKGLGAGYSAVAVVGERIYTAGDQGDASFVVSLNTADGKLVWSTKLGQAGEVGNPPFAGPRATPTVDGPLLYAINQFGEMVCLETSGGKEVWRKDYQKDFGGVRPEWGFSESALVDGEQVVVTPGGADGAVVALNKKTGALIWRSTEFKDSPHYASLVKAEIAGVGQYLQLTDQSVVGIGAADGKVLWRARRRGNVAVIPSPVYRDGFVYVSSGYGTGCNLFKISAADGKFTAEQVYANKVMANHHGGVVMVGDYLYGYAENRGWTCQDFKTGAAKWQVKDQLGKGSLLAADGRLILRQEDKQGTVVLLEASPEGYKEHGRFDQPDRSSQNSWPHPVVAAGKLYLRDQDLLLCYDLRQAK